MAAVLHDIADPQVSIPRELLLDTSLLLEAIWRKKQLAIASLMRLSRAALARQTVLLVPLLVMEECYFKLIEYHYRQSGYSQWHTEGYKKQPDLIEACWPQLDEFRRQVQSLPAVIAPGSHPAAVPFDLHRAMLENVRKFWLLPKDAYIAAEGERLEVRALATLDSDFDRLTGFAVYRPLEKV